MTRKLSRTWPFLVLVAGCGGADQSARSNLDEPGCDLDPSSTTVGLQVSPDTLSAGDGAVITVVWDVNNATSEADASISGTLEPGLDVEFSIPLTIEPGVVSTARFTGSFADPFSAALGAAALDLVVSTPTAENCAFPERASTTLTYVP